MIQNIKKLLQKSFFIFVGLGVSSLITFTSCTDNTTPGVLEENNLFSLAYGNYENEVNLFDLNNATDINTRHMMRDGFFYIANGEAGKIMQLTSYGDLIGIIYDSERNPIPTFIDTLNDEVLSALDEQTGDSTQIAVSYPFNRIGKMAVDNDKNLYVTDYLPVERYETDPVTGSILRQVILRFEPDGTFVDFLTQEGLGGLPFPLIQSLHTTSNNELIAVCLDTNGHTIFWFSNTGILLTKITFNETMIPKQELDLDTEMFISLESIIPSLNEPILYLKTDYYGQKVDESTLVASSIGFDKTLVHPYNVNESSFGNPISIPAYETNITQGYNSEVFLHPYAFLGVTESGGMFFSVTEESGLDILIAQDDGQSVVRRKIDIDLTDGIYQDFSISNTGIISALIAYDTDVALSWWRTDSVVQQSGR